MTPDPILLVRRALGRAGVTRPLQVVTDGDQAVAYLSGAAPYADRQAHALPALLLLDLKLPRRSGLDVLAWVKQQPLLKRLPVVVLTSSAESTDVNRAYDLGANSYLVKPVAFDELQRMLTNVHLFWLLTNYPPDV